MRKTLAVAWNEYLRNVRSKAFIIGVVLMPVLMGAGVFIIAIERSVKDVAPQSFVLIDRTGLLAGPIGRALEERNRSAIWDEREPDRQVRPRFLLEAAPEAGTEAELQLELARRVKDKELLGWMVVGADVPAGDGADASLAWLTNTPTNEALPNWLAEQIHEFMRQRRFDAAGLDLGLMQKLSARAPLEKKGLPSVGAEGELREAQASNDAANIAVPSVLAFLIYMLIFMNAPAMMNAVLEEKIQKIAEVLVSAVTPFELMGGKLLAAVMGALTLAVLYVGAGLLFLHNVEGVPPAVVEAVGPGILAWFGVFLVLGLLMYGSICTALGAACSELQDAQSLIGPVIMLCVFPMMFFGAIISHPDSTVSRVVSFIPTATPMLMLLRVAMPPGVPWWELLLSVLTTLLFCVGCIFAGSRIFRIGLLSQGQTPKFTQLIRWALSRR